MQSRAVHVPTREEGRKRAAATVEQWRQVEAVASEQLAEPPPQDGVLRLYRADRPGAVLPSAPLFTKDREAAQAIAARSGGQVSYVDVPASRLSEITPSRSDPENQFGVKGTLAQERKRLSGTMKADILPFRQRAESALIQSAQRAIATFAQTIQEPNGMTDLATMRKTFSAMEEQLQVLETNLPPQSLEAFGKAKTSFIAQRDQYLAAQEAVERKRGQIEGESYVSPKPQDLRGFRAGDARRSRALCPS